MGLQKDRLETQGVVKETIGAGVLGSLLNTQTRPRASTKRNKIPCHKWVDFVVKPALGKYGASKRDELASALVWIQVVPIELNLE